MSGRYETVRLDSVAEIIAGQSPPGSTYRDEPEGLPFYQGKADFGEMYPSPRKWCAEPKKVAEVGDILISVRAPVGPTNVADSRCCIGRGVAAIRAGRSVNPQYLLRALRHFEKVIAAKGTGSTFKAITQKNLRSIKIPLPPLAEQRRIAKVLDRADALRAKRRRAQERLDDLLRSVYHQIGGQPIKTKPGGQAELGWTWTDLSAVARLESGHTPSRRKEEYWGGKIPWLSLKDVSGLSQARIYDTRDCPTELGIANSSARMLPANTVALCRTASVGNVAILGREMATSQDFVNWVCGDQLIPEFLYVALLCSQQEFKKEMQGSTHKTIYMPTVKRFKVCLPPLAVQKKIADVLEWRERHRQRLADAIEASEDLYYSLAQRAFRGELTGAALHETA